MAPARWEAVRHSLDLTDRELQIVQALFEGQREDAIAQVLGISHYTVHTHLGRIYRKLQVDSCTSLLLRVFRECLHHDGTATAGRPLKQRAAAPVEATEEPA